MENITNEPIQLQIKRILNVIQLNFYVDKFQRLKLLIKTNEVESEAA